MSHSVYDNSPYDSNRDGHISASEQSNIHEIYHKDEKTPARSGGGSTFVIIIIAIILGAVFHDSPAVPLFFLGIAFSCSFCGMF